MSNLVTARNGSMANTDSNGLTFPRWSTWIDEMFNQNLPTVYSSNFNAGFSLPKVNIRETKDRYFVEMAVPGLKKSDFRIDLENQVLSISTEMEHKNENSDDLFVRREFSFGSFKRSFSLPETVKEEGIQARYREGILSIELPKKEEAIQKPARTIEIS